MLILSLILFGAMYQDDMLHYARLVDEKLDKEIYFGFHGHNNLMLADANGQCFVNEIGNHRNIIVDTSCMVVEGVRGMLILN